MEETFFLFQPLNLFEWPLKRETSSNIQKTKKHQFHVECEKIKSVKMAPRIKLEKHSFSSIDRSRINKTLLKSKKLKELQSINHKLELVLKRLDNLDRAVEQNFKDVTEKLVTAEGRSAYFKTRICRFYMHGYCRFGDSCRFAHGRNELRTLDVNNN